MGWWSENVMGGDLPLDIQSVIYKALGVVQFVDEKKGNYDNRPLCAMDFDSHPGALSKVKEEFEDCDKDDKRILVQVFTYMLMEAGGKMSDELRAESTQACIKDSWAKDHSLRAKIMDRLQKHIEKYDNQPVKNLDKDYGVFAKIDESLNPGLDIDKEMLIKKMETLLAELKSDTRASYPTADIFTNAPLALIQLGITAKVHLLEDLLGLPKSKFPLT